MKQLQVQGASGLSTILVGEPLPHLPRYLPTSKPVIITDENVARHYAGQFPDGHVITIGTGEAIKTLDTVQRIYAELVALEADRSSCIVGIGGGIVCDVAGFVASTYLRGVPFGFVPTTLLAQVDASVGGKNGVNFGGYKNMVGTFNQPGFVICDMGLLGTLPGIQIQCGFAEIVKHAAIADANMFAYLEQNADRALDLDEEVIEDLVYQSLVIKSTIVNRDEKETGERRKLNFGHTFGHAIEKVTGVPHGQAVSIGMLLAAELSRQRGLISAADAERLVALLERLGLPTRMAFDRASVLEALGKDKKREGDHMHFVVLENLGRAVVTEIPLSELRRSTAVVMP
jgi:3-dehydroquinate synthase